MIVAIRMAGMAKKALGGPNTKIEMLDLSRRAWNMAATFKRGRTTVAFAASVSRHEGSSGGGTIGPAPVNDLP
jgi:hypothetical protein